ncbi:hypothetical protein Salat_2615600 [Sesamum alatum]|uniref:Uncharacterized protein n=1 Tax=Sesamum alatum TaxID=300844 RepID=A0AAE2CAS8_9LAMI|nr:hypothetical protein Salat_2615600 [Sesamum alatum]
MEVFQGLLLEVGCDGSFWALLFSFLSSFLYFLYELIQDYRLLLIVESIFELMKYMDDLLSVFITTDTGGLGLAAGAGYCGSVIKQVTDHEARSSQEPSMMEMLAARMLYQESRHLNDLVDQRVEEFNKLGENRNGISAWR